MVKTDCIHSLHLVSCSLFPTISHNFKILIVRRGEYFFSNDLYAKMCSSKSLCRAAGERVFTPVTDVLQVCRSFHIIIKITLTHNSVNLSCMVSSFL